jgi:arylsulfatase A-like enzyme
MRAIVFVLRGCPAGWLGAYGNEWVGTPRLDRLAAEGVVFDRHVSDRPDAAGACRAWMGGPNPPDFPSLPGKGVGGLGGGGSLLRYLRAANVRTVLVRANHPDTDAPEWFYAGWDEVFDARPQQEDVSPLDSLIRTLPALLDRLAAAPDFLLWIETDRLLPPWDVRQDVFEAYIDDSEEDDSDEQEQDEEDEEEQEEENEEDQAAEDEQDDRDPDSALSTQHSALPNHSALPVTPWSDPPTGPLDTSDPDALDWLHNSFAAVVTTLDAELGTLFGQLRARGLDQSAVWLVTSDYGYPLGEHGYIGPHRPWLHEELVHLPLVLRLPGAAEAGRRVYGFTQPPDVAPTLLDLFGVKAEGFAGFSLLPLARGEAESRRPHAITSLELGDAAEAAIRTDEWALLLPVRVPEGEIREPQLFEKPDDRWEVNDLRSRNIERADELEQRLKNK